ncbi:hypothetical protein [Streptomyces sp. NPDC006274]|uniref:hypothetical protein n=1 Tax=unclassified Streptomyces TaxID=2593676 RepID=UPI0033B843FD
MDTTPLTPYARLPRHAHAGQRILHSTVDAFGRAHWLLTGADPGDGPYDASAVTVDDGRVEETRLSAVTARYPLLDALPDGGFVVADARRLSGADHVQVFDPLGRTSRTFAVGDGMWCGPLRRLRPGEGPARPVHADRARRRAVSAQHARPARRLARRQAPRPRPRFAPVRPGRPVHRVGDVGPGR